MITIKHSNIMVLGFAIMAFGGNIQSMSSGYERSSTIPEFSREDFFKGNFGERWTPPAPVFLRQKLPLVFHPGYDIKEGLHPFSIKGYGNIASLLTERLRTTVDHFCEPEKISDEDLRLVHTAEYLASLNSSTTIARIAENPSLASMPIQFLQKEILDPMRYGTAGTVLGVELALEYGCAINLAGGYHHAKRNQGAGFCYFADIPLAIVKARAQWPALKVLVVDLDAHQGNGIEAYLEHDKQTFMFDVYGADNYPHDRAVKPYITYDFPVANDSKDGEYSELLKRELPKAIEEVKPDLIIYNAGTDIYEKDRLGRMAISKKGIIDRDFFVWEQARSRNIPILMVLSGGYSSEGAAMIAESIIGLEDWKKYIWDGRHPDSIWGHKNSIN